MTRVQKGIVWFTVVLAVLSVSYRLVFTVGAEKSAALFVGVPAVVAIAVAMMPSSQSATGMIIRGLPR